MTALARTPEALTLRDLVAADCGLCNGVVPTGMTLDSREVVEGSVFVALPGREFDGRDYIADALAQGAAAVLAEARGLGDFRDPRVVPISHLQRRLPDLAQRFFGDPSASMALVAVTGTNGKTSVADFVAQLLRHQGVAAGSIGTLGARLGPAAGVARHTTPDVLSLTRQFAQWLGEGVDHVALEASSHALDQGRLAGINLHTGIFTNLSRDHLDYHGSEASYAASKLRLFSDFQLKRVIYNADDPVAQQARGASLAPSLGVSLTSAEADVFVQVLQQPQGMKVRLHTPWGTGDIASQLSGTFNAFNMVAAVLAVTGLGYRFSDVVHSAESLRPVVGRMQRLPQDADIEVIVDYAHTPDALRRALVALRPQTAGNLWVVFGCGGDRDRGKRPQMGAIADELADRVVVTSDNPRSEDPEAIIRDIRAGLSRSADVFAERRAAIEFAIMQAQPGDVVLIAGKGHEEYQEIDGVRHPFSDVAEAEACLAQRSGRD
jgi:UDP-N-acetylmuramoyl-L-alanyl-D-glutamate--2,6-diaminopimelate ligase